MFLYARMLACAATLVLACSAPAMATLIGTSVTGSMNIKGSGSTNFFDTANGYVPVGPENYNDGTTVKISQSLLEFGYADGANTDSADFTGTDLTLSDVSANGSVTVTYTFTDTAFNGLNLSEISDNFSKETHASLVGDQLTIRTSAFQSAGSYSAVYRLTAATPEPASLLLFGSGLVVCGLLARRKIASI